MRGSSNRGRLLLQLGLTALVAFVVAKVTMPASQGKSIDPPTQVAPTKQSEARVSSGGGIQEARLQRALAQSVVVEEESESELPTEVPPALSNEEIIESFRVEMEERIHTGAHDEIARDREILINDQLRDFSELSEAAPDVLSTTCTSSGCQVRLAHYDDESSHLFQLAVQSGRVLNTPDLLNTDNGCSLHSFGHDPGTDRQQTISIDCTGGNQNEDT